MDHIDHPPPTARAARIAASACGAALAPMVAHTLWRPLAVAIGSPTTQVALGLSVAAALLTVLISALGTATPRWLVGGLIGVTAGLWLGGAAAALSLGAVALFAGLALPPMAAALTRGAPEAHDPAPAHLAAWLGLALAATAGSIALATYFGDPTAVGCAIDGDGVIRRHLCFSAYMHAADLLGAGVANVYDLGLVPPEGAALPASAAHMAPFHLDRYGYPPQFLLLPLGLRAVIPDFFAQRAAWTSANALLFAWVLWRVGLWVGPRSGRIARPLAPALWILAGPVYQAGNVQLTVLGLGVVAMIAFHERRSRLGGALLAGVTLAKIAPGLLGVLLIARQRWRAILWTAAAAGAITAVTLSVTGWAVFAAFIGDHLPQIASGQAYDFLDDTPRKIFENLSPFGIPFKLHELGVQWDPWVWGPRFAHAYTAMAIGLAVAAGRRVVDRRGHAALWMLALTVAGLRSPMAPGYLLAGTLWALALAGAEVRSRRGWALGVALVIAMALATPFAPHNHVMALGAQLVMHGCIVWLMVRPWSPLDPEHRPSPLGGDTASERLAAQAVAAAPSTPRGAMTRAGSAAPRL